MSVRSVSEPPSPAARVTTLFSSTNRWVVMLLQKAAPSFWPGVRSFLYMSVRPQALLGWRT